MLTFAYPWMAVFIILPFVVRRFAPAHKTHQLAIRVPFLQRVAEILQQRPQKGAVIMKGGVLQTSFLWLCWLLILLTLARPQWIEDPIIRELPMRDMMLAVDLSGSMEATDFKSQDGNAISRLDAVKIVLDQFLEQRKGDRVGLIFFGSAPFLQVPFTEDLAVCRQLLKEAQVRMAGPQTAFGDAIGLAIQRFDQSEMEKRVLIVLTDGNDTASALPPSEAASIAAKNKITIYTVGVGDPEAVGEEKFDEVVLKAVAEVTNGQYFYAQDGTQLQEIYQQIDQLEVQKVQTQSYRPRNELFYQPLIIVMVLVFFYHGFKLAWYSIVGSRDHASA